MDVRGGLVDPRRDRRCGESLDLIIQSDSGRGGGPVGPRRRLGEPQASDRPLLESLILAQDERWRRA